MAIGLTQLEKEIFELKEKRNAQILAHFYEDGDIQDIADSVGDSLFLAQEGEKSRAKVILLAGVVFMAESVKILSPDKTVLVPDLEAGCSLVKGSPYKDYLKWRLDHPNAIAVTYVNSSAEVKAISDVICTSSNAVKVINAIPKNRQILFGPDKNLGRYLARTSGRDMIFWEGSCEVHVLFNAKLLSQLKTEHPDAIVVAHPECDDGVLSQADVVGSTSRLLEEVQKNPAKKFIVATEEGIFHQMKKSRPDVTILQAPIDESCGCNQCPYMKLNSLEKIRNALRDMTPEIIVKPEIAKLAKTSLDRMMAITHGQPVTWPDTFVAPQI